MWFVESITVALRRTGHDGTVINHTHAVHDCFYIGEIARLIRAAKKWVIARGSRAREKERYANRNDRDVSRERSVPSAYDYEYPRVYPTHERYVN